MIFTVDLDGNPDTGSQAGAVIVSGLFAGRDGKSIGHAGDLLFTVELGENNLHLYGNENRGPLLGLGLFLGLVLRTGLPQRQDEQAKQAKIDELFHCTPPGEFESAAGIEIQTEVISIHLPSRA